MARTLFLIILLLIISVYLQYYLKFNSSYRIIQASLDRLDENTLFEKYPIVINDRIAKPETLLETLFKYKYFSKKFVIQHGSPNPYLTCNKYLLIYNIKSNIDVNVILPTYKKEFRYKSAQPAFQATKDLSNSNVQYVTIRLKKQQILVLPAFWLYQTELPHHTIALNDPFSSLVNFFYIWTAP